MNYWTNELKGYVPRVLIFLSIIILYQLVSKRTLQGALAAGREREGEPATTSLEFEDLHRKSRCKMLIGGDDISNDVITLGTCFQCLSDIRRLRALYPIGAYTTGIEKALRNKLQQCLLYQVLFLFLLYQALFFLFLIKVRHNKSNSI